MVRPRNRVQIPIPGPARLPTTARPGESAYPFWQRLVVAPGEEVKTVALAHHARDWHAHFKGNTYVPCLWDWDQDCPYHDDDRAPRLVYGASLPVVLATGGRIFLANFTPHALRGCPELLGPKSVMGRVVHIRRRAGGRNAMMQARLGAHAGAGFAPEKAFSQEEIWRVQLNVWGVELEFGDNGEAVTEWES